jgi:hypothetical protein
MLIQYTICGNVYVDQTPVIAEYVLRNLTTGYTSETMVSLLGYFSLNTANFKDTVFNIGDIISIEFKYTDGSNEYFTRVYTVMNIFTTTTTIIANLVKDWNYTAAINVIPDATDINKVTINFITSLYRDIIYKLYYKFDGVYKEIYTATIDKQTVNLTFPHSGEYLITGYVTFGSMLVAYASKEFVMEVGDISPITNTNNIKYIEWE